MIDKPKPPAKPGMEEVSPKFVDEAEAATAAPPSSAGIPDDPLVALGRQWEVAYDNWLEFDTTGASNEEVKALEARKSDLGEIVWRLEDQAADIPARSIAGVLIQLRMAGEHYYLMERDGTKKEEWANTYAQLTWQAWDGLERMAGEAAPISAAGMVEDPVLALKREWESRYKTLDEQRDDADADADDSDEALEPFYKRLDETELQILHTRATTPAGVAVKLILWARQHLEAGTTSGLNWNREPIDGKPLDLDRLPVMSALLDLEGMAQGAVAGGSETPPAEDAALFEALAEYDRLVAIEQGLEHHTKVFRPGIPEAEEADKAYKAACDETMEAWTTARDIPATTQAGLFAKLQEVVRFMDDLGEAELYEAEWRIIRADVQRVAGQA